MTQVTKLDKAKAQLVLDHPFFASILLKKPLTADNSIPTLCVNARGAIRYNEKFINSLSVPQIVWGLCHEIGHVIGQHAMRKKHRDHKKWNYAGDAWINDMLRDCHVGEAIPNTVDMPGSKDKTTEQIYDELPDNGGGNGGGSGDGDGNGNDDSFDNGLGDDISYEDMTEDQIKEIEAQVKVEIAQAAQAAKARGKLPGRLAEIVSDLLSVKTPWHEILERHMTNMVKSDYSWTRPNRRFIGAGAYLPSAGKLPSMGELVVQVDVSGSISQRELAYYSGHLSRIIAQCAPTKTHVIYTDTQVQRYDTFEQGQEVKLEFFSGGGTHMPAGFDFVAEHGITPDAFVCLTDGYSSWETSVQIDYPVIWCVSSNVVPPYGECIHFEME